MASDSYLVCNACGTQHPTADRASLATCFICDDPRQYIPPAGQSFTTLAALRAAGDRRNEFHPIPFSSSSTHPSSSSAGGKQDDSTGATTSSSSSSSSPLTSIVTVPSFGIGQRAILIRTPRGNVLWDCVAYLDDATVAHIRDRMGGDVRAMVISHPHFYTTHLEWAEAFGCPVYLAAEDQGWLARRDARRQVFLEEVETPIMVEAPDGSGRLEDTGVRVIKLGGHFPGSMVLLYDGHLLTADTLMMTPAGRSNWRVDALGRPRAPPAGANTFSFLWSIPNMIPLGADEIARMWAILKRYDFRSAHGLMRGFDIEDDNLKARVLESMQIQIRAMGHGGHPLLKETL